MPNDTSRLGATSPDEYSLSIEEASYRYDHAGHPRTIRSIQRYCARGDLDCLRQETAFGEKYLITPTSVAKHIAQIDEVTRTTGRDLSRLVAQYNTPQPNQNTQWQAPPTVQDMSRHVAADSRSEIGKHDDRIDDEQRLVATRPGYADKYVNRLEEEVTFLREEIATKNAQIKELSERSRETNLLIGGLQRMLSPLLGSPDPYPPRPDDKAN